MVTQSIGAIQSAAYAGNQHKTTVEGVNQGRSMHEEHMLAVRRNIWATDTAMHIAPLFAVLSDPTRLQVVYARFRAVSGELCVGDKEASNLNVRAAMLHVFGDVGASAGVIVAGLIILFTGWTFVDPLISVGIAVWPDSLE